METLQILQDFIYWKMMYLFTPMGEFKRLIPIPFDFEVETKVKRTATTGVSVSIWYVALAK